MASARGEQFVVVDGQEGKDYDGIESLGFSPDSQRGARGSSPVSKPDARPDLCVSSIGLVLT